MAVKSWCSICTAENDGLLLLSCDRSKSWFEGTCVPFSPVILLAAISGEASGLGLLLLDRPASNSHERTLFVGTVGFNKVSLPAKFI